MNGSYGDEGVAVKKGKWLSEVLYLRKEETGRWLSNPFGVCFLQIEGQKENYGISYLSYAYHPQPPRLQHLSVETLACMCFLKDFFDRIVVQAD